MLRKLDYNQEFLIFSTIWEWNLLKTPRKLD